MFKKIILATIIAVTPFVYFFTQAYLPDQIEFKSVSDIEFSQSANDTPFWRLTIIAKEFDVINIAHGITITLPEGEPIQWDGAKTGAVKLSGSAAGKIKDPMPTISENMYQLHLNVKENFGPGDELNIEGLYPRTYKRSMSSRSLGLDVTGDGVPELHNMHSFSIKSVARTDFLAPSDPMDFNPVYEPAKNRVNITWKNPRDFDFWQVVVTRERMVSGKKQKLDIYSGPEDHFIDTSLINGDVTYYIYAVDEAGNNSGLVKKVIHIGEADEPTPPEPVDEPVVDLPKPKVSTAEKAELNRLLNYYYIRYQIKCLAATADPTSSLCLWSKIDLIYAQNAVGTIKANVYLTENDIRLMRLRVRWPEDRYRTKCEEADVPDKTCPALEDSLKRTHYFID